MAASDPTGEGSTRAGAAPLRRGLLVDWGGVLTSDVFASFQAFCAEEGLPPERVGQLFARDPLARELLADFERGKLPEEEFEVLFAERLELAEPAGLIRRLFGGLQADVVMQEAVIAFRRAGIRTGMLSNSWGPQTYDRSRLGELFDVLVVSGEEGIRKPEPEIYALAAERMGMAPEQLVFVDDLRGNLKPARALGMATVHHTEAAATLAELEELLGVAVPLS